MSGRVGYTVAGEWFRTKADLQGRVRGILYSYHDGDVLSDPDTAFVADLLSRHPDSEQKIGVGIGRLVVEREPRFGGLGFVVVRIDGTRTDFSYIRCMFPLSRLQKFKRACRRAVVGDVLSFRRRAFAGGPVTCPFSGDDLDPGACHIDHAPPWTFDRIVSEFIERRGIDVESVGLAGEGEDGSIGVDIEDDDLRAAFRTFHNERANLRAVSRIANLSIIKRAAA